MKDLAYFESKRPLSDVEHYKLCAQYTKNEWGSYPAHDDLYRERIRSATMHIQSHSDGSAEIFFTNSYELDDKVYTDIFQVNPELVGLKLSSILEIVHDEMFSRPGQAPDGGSSAT